MNTSCLKSLSISQLEKVSRAGVSTVLSPASKFSAPVKAKERKLDYLKDMGALGPEDCRILLFVFGNLNQSGSSVSV